ncbi:MAG TPA: formylglycine-generating enzyme family protein [Gammaproteobacteria bacterium]|nr:formylglycine-generating enzyme family protein [Gammaproteobacteria bacterium]
MFRVLLKSINKSISYLFFVLLSQHSLASILSECQDCHSSEQMDEKHVFEIVDECSTCHANSKNHKTANVEPHERHAATALAFPLYDKTSRIGSKPNKMVMIPAGEFIMGTNDRLPDEGPEHKRTLKRYYIDIFEVTNLQYKAFIDATGRRSPQHFRNRTFPEGKADHPVTYVSWKDANAYCAWAGKRLPTDAEWEKAARGEKGNIFPWGSEFDIDKANTPQRWKIIDMEGDTTPVGAFPDGKSPYGLYDMSGNVWEWTASWYEAYPGNTHKTENYGHKYKTLKGGSWWDCSFYQCGISAPVYNRSFFLRSTKNSSFGFRCASDTPVGEDKGVSTLK